MDKIEGDEREIRQIGRTAFSLFVPRPGVLFSLENIAAKTRRFLSEGSWYFHLIRGSRDPLSQLWGPGIMPQICRGIIKVKNFVTGNLK